MSNSYLIIDNIIASLLSVLFDVSPSKGVKSAITVYISDTLCEGPLYLYKWLS